MAKNTHRMTPREREIVKLITKGFNNAQIATQLGSSPKTIEAHRSNVYRKLGIGKAALLVRWAIEEGIA